MTALIRCGACGERAFLKKVLGSTPAESEELAQRLFATAADIRRDFPVHARFGVAAPWQLTGTALIFEYVPGPPPTKALATGPIELAAGIAGNLGEWFAIYHACQTNAHPTPATDRTRHGDLNERIRNLASRYDDVGLSGSVASEALAAVSNRVKGLIGTTGRSVCLHGDAKPDNFLLDGGRLVGIDIEGRYWSDPEHDLAQFVTQLRLACTGLTCRFDAARLATLESAMTEGYLRRAPLDGHRLAALRLLYMLGFWLSWRSSTTIQQWWWDPIFRRHLRALLGS